METKEDFWALEKRVNANRLTPKALENDISRVASLAFKSLPVDVLSLVRDYLSDNDDKIVKYALLDEQPIALCFSQDVHSKLSSCWCLGFLSPERQWREEADVKVDIQFSMKDHESCLNLLSKKSPNYCRVFIDILVVQLRVSSSDHPSALDDLRITIEAIRKHLTKVKHMIISIADFASLCFSLQPFIDNASGIPQPFDRQKALDQIVNDVDTYWKNNHTFDICDLLAFFFKRAIKPTSEKYLSKFVISHIPTLRRRLSIEKDPKMVSDKILWAYYLKLHDEFCVIDQTITRLCHFFHLDLSEETRERFSYDQYANQFFSYQNNHVVKRIVINSGMHGCTIQLPRPSAPLTDTSTLSALVEITLNGYGNILHLTDLNNGYFPHLAHLSVIGGWISGQLDSHRVPSLKTLFLEGDSFYGRYHSTKTSTFRGLIQSVIRAGRPWQLFATRTQCGWSLASYDKYPSNPYAEKKEDSNDSPPHFRPLIRELILVGFSKQNVDEWQSQLSGAPPLEAAAGDGNIRRLVWAPERVEKITAICHRTHKPVLAFKKEIFGRKSILSSLTCSNIDLEIEYDALPRLRSLDLNYSQVTLPYSFPRLQILSFQDSGLQSPWEVNAPLLESLDCHNLEDGKKLILRPASLPLLSFLKITRDPFASIDLPSIIMDKNNLGLSRINYLVFGNTVNFDNVIDRWLVYNVSHLELQVSELKLLKCWKNTEWQCKTLKILVWQAPSHPCCLPAKKRDVMLPHLPRVNKLTMTEEFCHVYLDRKMFELIECSVPSPKSLGPNLKCPSLKRIHFTDALSESDRKECLDRATYVAIGARPRWIHIDADGDVFSMDWDDIPHESEALPLVESLHKNDEVSLLERILRFLFCDPVSQILTILFGLGLLFLLLPEEQR